jgi:prepilin-type N-terminal cleavage/methylation domain-containing protein
MINFNKKALQSGRSMIEMLGVLAIVGILSAGGIAGYSMVMQSYKTNQLIERVQLISSRIKSVYKDNYTGITKQNMIDSGKLSESDFQNPFGGDITVSYASTSGVSRLVITTQSNVPAETCTDILTMDWGNNLYLVQAYNGNTKEIDGHGSADITVAINICKGGNKRMAWWF